jgi:hypothetical protein
MGRLDVEVRRGSIGCHVWVVGVLWACKYMMFRGCFRNSFFGSFFESFGVSPSGEFLRGLGMKYPFLFIKTGCGCALVFTLCMMMFVPCH